MRPRRTHTSNRCFRLPGGNEDNDLWTTVYDESDGGPAIGSTWELSDEDRQAISEGASIELIVVGQVQPPVQVRISPYPLGKRPELAS